MYESRRIREKFHKMLKDRIILQEFSFYECVTLEQVVSFQVKEHRSLRRYLFKECNAS